MTTNNIRQFESPSSRRLVTINLSPNRCAFLVEVSTEQLLAKIAEYEKIRIAEYWDDVMLAESKKGPWINAFITTGPGLIYMTSAGVQKAINSKNMGARLFNEAKALPVTQQREILSSMMPEKRANFSPDFAKVQHAIAPDFYAMVQEAGSFLEFVNAMVHDLNTDVRASCKTA